MEHLCVHSRPVRPWAGYGVIALLVLAIMPVTALGLGLARWRVRGKRDAECGSVRADHHPSMCLVFLVVLGSFFLLAQALWRAGRHR